MAQQVIAGWGATVKYDFETSLGTGGTPTYAFGKGTKITVKRNQNLERVAGLGSRNAQFTVAKKFEGTMTIEFIMGNAYWLRGVIGAQGAAGGSGPYTHAFTEADVPPSMCVTVGADLGTNDMVTSFTGVCVQSCKMALAVNESIKVTLECLYQTESTATSGTFSAVDDTFADPMTFAQGSVTYAGQAMGLTYSGIVQNFELTINNNLESVYGVGSRTFVGRVNKLREYNFRMSYALASVSNAADVFENFMGDTSAPFTPAAGNTTGVALVLTITNGGATTSLRSLVFTFTSAKAFLNTSSMVFDINELLKDDVEGWAESISSVVYTDNTNSGIGA